jgi:2-oxoglutarate ferredoxin oxidoreductase subunit alpha
VDAQRGGPSTGLPTKTEQSDLNQALYGSHGDAPRIVIAPVSVEDCFFATIDAFNYAEQYQLPVILLTDQGLATRLEVIHRPDTSQITLTPRKTSKGIAREDYKRYEYTPDHVSPMGIPGEPNGMYVATGIEHDEYGHPAYTPEIHLGMGHKRWDKLEPLKTSARQAGHGESHPTDVAFIGFGSTFGPVREAIDRLLEQGLSVGSFYPRILMPFPADKVIDFVKDAKRVVVPEVNFTGQLARLIKAETGIELESVAKCDGLPFTAEAIMDLVTQEVAA